MDPNNQAHLAWRIVFQLRHFPNDKDAKRDRAILAEAHQRVHGEPYLTPGEARWLYENDQRYHLFHEQLANQMSRALGADHEEISPGDLAAFLREPSGPEIEPQEPKGFVAVKGVYSPAELLLALAREDGTSARKLLGQLQTGLLVERTELIARTAQRQLGENQAERLEAALLSMPMWSSVRGFE
jgi:hypothetical protein